MATKQVLTLKNVAAAAGVSLTTLDNWRKGTPTKTALPASKEGHNVVVSVSELKTWAKTHGVTLDSKVLASSAFAMKTVGTKVSKAKPGRKTH